MGTVNFALRTSPELKAAAHVLSHTKRVPLYKKSCEGSGEVLYSALRLGSINESFNTLIKEGISPTLGIIETELSTLASARDSARGIMRFFMDNPVARHVLPANFPENSDERAILEAHRDDSLAAAADEDCDAPSLGRFDCNDAKFRLLERLGWVARGPEIGQSDVLHALTELQVDVSALIDAKGALMRAIAT